MYKTNNVFSKIDKMFCVEIDSVYCQLIKNRIEEKYGEFRRKTETKRKV